MLDLHNKIKREPIDLSDRNLIPERIREFAMKAYDRAMAEKKTSERKRTAPSQRSRDLQLLGIQLGTIEYTIRTNIGHPSVQALFEKTKANGNQSEALRFALQAVVTSDDDEKSNGYNWRTLWTGNNKYVVEHQGTVRVPVPYVSPPSKSGKFPLFQICVSCNEMDPGNMLRHLCNTFSLPNLLPADFHFTLDELDDVPRFYFDENMPFAEILSRAKENDSLGIEAILKISSNNENDGTQFHSVQYYLRNFALLEDSADQYTLRPVFIFEDSGDAQHWESEIRCGYSDYLRETLHFYFPVREIDPYYSEGKDNDGQTHKSEFLPYRLIAGDAVCVSPLGGYSAVDYTYFGFNENSMGFRDIFIFKFMEKDSRVYLNEFLKITKKILYDNCTMCQTVNREGEVVERKDFAKKITYVVLSEKTGPTVADNDIKYWKIYDLFNACDEASIHIPDALKDIYDLYLRDMDRKGRREKFVIYPFLRKKSWMLITGEEGTGKTFFAMALSAAIATTPGEIFPGWGWNVPDRHKVLYIADDEMTEEMFYERAYKLKEVYQAKEQDWGKYFSAKIMHRLNLLEENGRKEVMEYIDKSSKEMQEPVRVVVLDHLRKLTDREGDQKEPWETVLSFIEELCDKGISVILLHHEFASGKMLGSRIVPEDAPAWIHLEKLKEDNPPGQIRYKIALSKNRGGADMREAKDLILDIGANPHWIVGGMQRERTFDKGMKFRAIKDEQERISIVKKLRDQGLTNNEIAKRLGCCASSIQKVVQKFAKSEKRRKYYPRQDAKSQQPTPAEENKTEADVENGNQVETATEVVETPPTSAEENKTETPSSSDVDTVVEDAAKTAPTESVEKTDNEPANTPEEKAELETSVNPPQTTEPEQSSSTTPTPTEEDHQQTGEL